ncbi:Fumarate hydratase class II [gamma proteobacterium IMCC2047]|nr:Fumarate hydratase class II [gamma proteobacterium IMCC2047]
MATKYPGRHDGFDPLNLPVSPLYSTQTQCALENFPVSGLVMPRVFITPRGTIKKTAAQVNVRLGLLDKERGEAIAKAAALIQSGQYLQHFPVDVFQTGSGTSTNMNVNEVIATLAANSSGLVIHPNDHVNLGQSSNDVIPTAIHISAVLQLNDQLLPALDHLQRIIGLRAQQLESQLATGRTHLMDAMPISLGQQLSGWQSQIEQGVQRIKAVLPRLSQIAQGGTAVGTGVNTHTEFADQIALALTTETGHKFIASGCFFESLSCQDTAVELSGQLRVIAVSLMKIANDLRWMNSGPLAGFGEIELEALQPGSSIMPGKVNPVIPESVAMVAAQVMGNDATIAIAGQSGNFQLNVMLPVIAYNLLQSIQLLASSSRLLADKAIATFKVNSDRLQQNLARNPILVTALTSLIGYEKAADIAKQAYRQQRAIIDVAEELTTISRAELEQLLDPQKLI